VFAGVFGAVRDAARSLSPQDPAAPQSRALLSHVAGEARRLLKVGSAHQLRIMALAPVMFV
jgi:hypothetical protein